ncbi:MAG: Ig-like domain-containing protein [Rhodobacterales bacterium]
MSYLPIRRSVVTLFSCLFMLFAFVSGPAFAQTDLGSIDLAGISVTPPATVERTVTLGAGTVSQVQLSMVVEHRGLSFANETTITITPPSGTAITINGNEMGLPGSPGGAYAVNETITLSTPEAAAGVWAVVLSDAQNDGGNPDYIINSGTLTFQQTSLSQTITAPPVAATYGDNVTFTATASSALPVSYDLSGCTGILASDGGNVLSAGSCTATASQAGDASYSAAPDITFTLTLAPLAITVTADAQTKNYGDTHTIDNTAFTTSSLPNGESIDTATLTGGTGVGGDTTAGVNTYAGEIEVSSVSGSSGFDVGNYDVTYVAGDLIVTPRAITLTADTQSKGYGDALARDNTAFTAPFLPNGESIETVISSSATGIDTSRTADVGTYIDEITISGASGVGGFDPSNYNISYTSGDLTVTPRAITVTASTQSKEFGETLTLDDTAFIAPLLPNGEQIIQATMTSTIAADSNAVVGTYTDDIVITGITGSNGFSATNYTMSFLAGDLVVVDTTAPTVSIGPLTPTGNGTYTAAITLSEVTADFALDDLTLTNASAALTGSGSSYTATLTPTVDGEIRLSVAAVTFTDAAGNDNTASNEVTTTYDGTAPTVSITDAPTSFTDATVFTVTVTFSESVTGFESSDITAANATITGVSGSGATYAATLLAAGTGDITLYVPADVASDATGNGNLASNTVSVANQTAEHTQELIANYMQTRANQLVSSQPSLIGFLSGNSSRTFDLVASRGNGSFDFSSGGDYPIWMQANGSWTNDGDSESQYLFGAFGGHQTINESLLVGAMLQFDRLQEDTGAASVTGTGWMAGPYFVARAPNQALYFEGRLLYGQTSNAIKPFGTYEDDFTTERMLAQLKVAGDISYDTTTFSPFVDASYTTDDQQTYTDGLGNAIAKQGIALGQIEIGIDFRHSFAVREGKLEIWGGTSGIWSHVSGSGFASTVTPNFEGSRARIELGLNRSMSVNKSFSLTSHYDGIGAGDYESYGLSIGFETQF